MTIRGIDISKYQQVIDWRKVKASGVVFVYIRVLDDDGLRIDPYFNLNWTQSKNVGMLRGAYIPFYAWNDPMQVARNVFNALDPIERGDWWMGELPIAIDYEPHEITRSPAFMQQRLLTVINEIERLCLVKPIIYTSAYTWDTYVNPKGDFVLDPLLDLWVANYIFDYQKVGRRVTTWDKLDAAFPTFNPAIPNTWKFIGEDIWQAAGDDGFVDGVANACDMDHWRGTYQELVEWGEAHKIPETDSEPDHIVDVSNMVLPFDSREMDSGVHELDLLSRLSNWFVESLKPPVKMITNQMVFNAFFKVYGGDDYWNQLTLAVGGQDVATQMAANRDGAFVALEKLPVAVNDLLGI